jgi:hypothetical protein
MGIKPGEPGWESIDFSPRPPELLEHAELTIPLPRGEAVVQYERSKGYTVTVPPGVTVTENAPPGVEVKVVKSIPPKQAVLTPEQQALLEGLGWNGWVGEKLAVWVSVDEQMFRIVEGDTIRWQVPCATATKGTGNVMNSYQTPLGWHSVARKVGEGAPWGRVFRGGGATEEVWKPGQDTEEDLVLTRVLMLAGEEPGKNKGGNVDSFARCIYIHGTNGEEAIGRPSSHGCVRLRNDDVIEAFGLIPEGTRVLVSER